MSYTPEQARFAALAEDMVEEGLLISAATPAAPVVQMDYAPAEPGKVRLFYKVGVSPAEVAEVEAFIGAWDWTPRNIKELAALTAELLAWVDVPGAQPAWVHRLAKVACAAAAEHLRNKPGLLRKLGEAIDGDEPVS